MFSVPGSVLARATGIVSGALGAIVNIFIILVIGLYLAFQRNLYTNRIIHLVLFKHRPRAREVIDALDETLGWWLIGRLVLMVVTVTTCQIGCECGDINYERAVTRVPHDSSLAQLTHRDGDVRTVHRSHLRQLFVVDM